MTVYCTQADIEKLFSQRGLEDYSDHEETAGAVATDCIEHASGEIELYTRGRYSEAGLSSSTLIKHWTTVLATVFLCERRGNPVPESLAKEAERIYGLLQNILDGTMNLPGVAFGNDLRPAFSNLTIDRRYRRAQQRVVTETSSNQTPEIERHEAKQVVWDNQ
jgi:phage gp36-like protein